MKNTLTLLLLFTVCRQLDAQTLTMDRVPKQVAHALHAKYASAQQESWEMAGKGIYQVAFFYAKKGLTARFDSTGKWLATETDITGGQIPRPINQVINKEFGGYNIQIISQVESSDGSLTYEAVLFKGRENWDVIFSAKGEVLKKEAGQPNE